MKILITFCCLLAVVIGEIPLTSNKHHTQHEQTVNMARQNLQEKLSKLESQTGYNLNRVQHGAQYGNSYATGGSEKYVVGCSTCYSDSENRASYNSRQSSSSSSQQARSGAINSEYGVGIVGRSNDDGYSEYEDQDVQNVVTPKLVESSRYSSNAYEAEDMQQRQVPADLNLIGSSAYRSSVSKHDEDELQRTVGVSYQQPTLGSSSRIYSRTHGQEAGSESSSSGILPSYVSSSQSENSQRSSHQSESSLHESAKPVSTGQHVSISSRPGASTVVSIPARIAPNEQQTYYSRTAAGTESRISSSGAPTVYRVIYNPVRNYAGMSSVSESEKSRSSAQYPEKLTSYNSFNTQGSELRSRADESETRSEQTQSRVAPTTYPTYPINGGTSRYASSASSSLQKDNTQTRIAPVFPVDNVESSSSSSSSALRTAEEREQRRYTPSAPTYVSSSRISASEQEENRNNVGNRQSYGRIPASGQVYYSSIPARSQTQYQQQQQTGGSQYQRQGYAGGNFSPYVPRTQSSNSQLSSQDILSQRFGSGVLHSNSDDLRQYMSEAERLARIQQQQIAGSSSSHVANSNSEANQRTLQTAAKLDAASANFVTSSRNSEFDTDNVSNLGTNAGTGGYNKVRSWKKQSNWSSGSEYGSDGKPKTYSSLSTAEAEKYNVNGAEAGYKAATSTLENDGKVSTYSIHT